MGGGRIHVAEGRAREIHGSVLFRAGALNVVRPSTTGHHPMVRQRSIEQRDASVNQASRGNGTANTADSRVQTAIRHWAPRFVANGVPLTDFQEVTAGVERWEGWCAAWCERAARHEELGRAAL